MLMHSQSSTDGPPIDLSDPAVHQTIARNAMAVVFNLKMTGWLVTRCAGLHHSPVFLVDVAHQKCHLTHENVHALSETLRVSVEILVTKTTDFQNRSQVVTKYLRAEGRLSEEGVPIYDEDHLLG